MERYKKLSTIIIRQQGRKLNTRENDAFFTIEFNGVKRNKIQFVKKKLCSMCLIDVNKNIN